MSVKSILIEVSPGEMIDKITILSIKSERISDGNKLVNINHELAVLSDKLNIEIPRSSALDNLMRELKEINEKLWEIEDDIRNCERENRFSDDFVQLARAVYKTNDRRSDLKRKINLLLGSAIVEEKSYNPY